jgi:hypothetical protein
VEIHDGDVLQCRPADTIIIDYEITTSEETTRIDAVPSLDIKVVVVPDNNNIKKGYLGLGLSSDVYAWSRVAVFVNDDKSLLMATFYFNISH